VEGTSYAGNNQTSDGQTRATGQKSEEQGEEQEPVEHVSQQRELMRN
jgi:hypothetical protein